MEELSKNCFDAIDEFLSQCDMLLDDYEKVTLDDIHNVYHKYRESYNALKKAEQERFN